MSVIAKLSLRDTKEFAGGALLEMGCVCESDLMAMSATSDEDKLFTNASPWGEARLHLNITAQFPQAMQGDAFYAMLVHQDEPGFTDKPQGAFLTCPARIASVTDYGGTTRQVEMTSGQTVPKESTLQRFNWRMSIDNPPAADQLKPGSTGWMLSLYRAGEFSRNTAIAAAHGRCVAEPAEA